MRNTPKRKRLERVSRRPSRSYREICHAAGGQLWGFWMEEDGARYRVRTCDPFRVREVLYH